MKRVVIALTCIGVLLASGGYKAVAGMSASQARKECSKMFPKDTKPTGGKRSVILENCIREKTGK